MSNYRQLLLLSSKVLSTYDPESSGVDTHLEKFLQLPECSVSTHTHMYTCTSTPLTHAHIYTHTCTCTHTHTLALTPGSQQYCQHLLTRNPEKILTNVLALWE